MEADPTEALSLSLKEAFMSGRKLSTAGILALALSGWLIAGGTARPEAQDGQEGRDSDRERRDRGGRSSRGAPGGRGGMNDRFNQASPDLGETLPEISAYDADGKVIQLRSALAGHYSVIVFGCLT